MQRYHDTHGDPLPIHSPQRAIERADLVRQMAEFLERGGKVEQVGHRMSSAPATFTINPEGRRFMPICLRLRPLWQPQRQ